MAPAVFPKTPEHVITDILSLLKQPVDTLPALGDNFFFKNICTFLLKFILSFAPSIVMQAVAGAIYIIYNKV